MREEGLLHFCFFLKVFLCECPDLSVSFLVFFLFFLLLYSSNQDLYALFSLITHPLSADSLQFYFSGRFALFMTYSFSLSFLFLISLFIPLF